MRLRCVTPPAAAPLTLTQAKAWCYVDGDQDDALIAHLIDSAVDQLDGRAGLLGRALEPQTWELVLDGFPAGIGLPLGPVAEVVEIAYEDALGARQVVPEADWRLERGAVEACVAPVAAWPSPAGKVTVTWIAGEGCPAGVLQVIRQTVKYWYDNRETSELPPGAVRAIASFRRQAI